MDFRKLKNEGITLWSEQVRSENEDEEAESCHAECVKHAYMVGSNRLSDNKGLSRVEGMEGAQSTNEASAAKTERSQDP